MTQVRLRDMWSYPLRLHLKRIRTEMTRSLTLCSNTSCPAGSTSGGSLSSLCSCLTTRMERDDEID